MRKILKKVIYLLKILKSYHKSYLRYIIFSLQKTNNLKKIGNQYFIANFMFNSQLEIAKKKDSTIENLKNFSSRDSIFIDIGANIGVVSLIISKYVERVYSFEPVLSSYKNLCENIELNKTRNIIPLNIALSDRSSIIELTNIPFGETNKVVKTHLVKSEICSDYNFINSYAFKLDDLEKFFDISSSKRVLIKIDTESHEIYILKGSKLFLEKEYPILICMEQNIRVKKELEYFMKEIKYTQINTGQINGFLDDPQNLYFANEKFMKCMKDYM